MKYMNYMQGDWSLEDMHTFGNPLPIPIVTVECTAVMYGSVSMNSNFISVEDDAVS